MKKKLFCLALLSLLVCGCDKTNTVIPQEHFGDAGGTCNGSGCDSIDNNNNNNGNIEDPHYVAEPKITDDTTNITWTTYENVGVRVSSLLVEKASQIIDDFFDIPLTSVTNGGRETETKSIKSDSEFNAFKNKIAHLSSDSRIIDSYAADFPVVDFSKYKIELTLLYKDNCNVDFTYRFMDIYTGNPRIMPVLDGDYDKSNLTNAVAVGVFYIILPKDSSFRILATWVNYSDHGEHDTYVAKKPIVYFYPEKEMDLTVKFVDEERLITTYPKYNDGWNIHLKEDGTFTSGDSDREYYALYFDEIANYICDFKEGFYVTKDNAISFLEEKMDYIGFNNHEVNEFIMYWLPVLENNEKSLVYFEQTDERNNESPLEFSTNPDTLIRTIIHIKKVDEEVDIPKQELIHYDRNGFVVTEWGGVEY